MDAQLNRKSLALGIPGIVLQIVGNVVVRMQPDYALIGVVITLGGTVLLIAGLSYYAQAKGHSGWWGLMGFLSCLGLLVLALLPDRRK